ncbi:MAG: hypothetical protein ABI298_07075, partial [Acidimicrobiales bacterium]
MKTSLRSEGWTVRPSFVPNGPTSPVALLADDTGLTQLAGQPAVAWQTPWSELANPQLIRFPRGLALFATVDGVRYCWRKRNFVDFEELRTLVLAHGGTIARHHRRAGVYAVALIVLLAALAGGIGSWLNRGSSKTGEIADVRSVNLSLKDLPSSWFVKSVSPIQYLFTPVGKIESSSTTLPNTSPEWTKVTTIFQRCLGVSNIKDRVYGAAGQLPNFQISSKSFSSGSYGGIDIESTTQYYQTALMVRRDTAEMSKANFGSCFVTSNVALFDGIVRTKSPNGNVGVNFQPVTFEHGFVRGGEAELTLPGSTGPAHLVSIEITSAHYEVTMSALVAKWPQSKLFIGNLANILLS